MISLEEYVIKSNSDLYSEYQRMITPFYYETGVLYHAITSGYSCGSRGSKNPLLITDCHSESNGDFSINLQSQLKPENKYSVRWSEIHRSIKRIDDTATPIGNLIPNNRKVIYPIINGIEYSVVQHKWNNYYTGKLAGSITVREEDPTLINGCAPYYMLYTASDRAFIKHVYSYNTVKRAQYYIISDVTVKKFKEIVFGNPNAKLICSRYGDFINFYE